MLPQSLLSNYTFSYNLTSMKGATLLLPNRICVLKLRQQKLVHLTSGSFKDPQAEAGAKLFGCYWAICTILPPKQAEGTRPSSGRKISGGNEVAVEWVICWRLNRLLLNLKGWHLSAPHFNFTSIFIFDNFSRGCFLTGSEILLCQRDFTDLSHVLEGRAQNWHLLMASPPQESLHAPSPAVSALLIIPKQRTND